MQRFSRLFIFLVSIIVFNICDAMMPNVPVVNSRRVAIIGDMVEGDGMAAGGTEMVVCQVRDGLRARGYEVRIIGIDEIKPSGVSFIPEFFGGMMSSLFSDGAIKRVNDNWRPDYIFIPLLGPRAHEAAAYCAQNGIPSIGFASCRSALCAAANAGGSGIRANVVEFFDRIKTEQFYRRVTRLLVPSESMRTELLEEGFNNVIAWPHGVDLTRFSVPTAEEKTEARTACNLNGLSGPFNLWVGRLSGEKNLPAFLNANLPGTKIVVGPEGSGFTFDRLRREYPNIIFAGRQVGVELLKWYKAADVFVFTSKIDTFGLVMLEALACGVPVVGFNTCGPRDVAPQGCGVSYLTNDVDTLGGLEVCATRAWNDRQEGRVTPEMCRAYAERFSWPRAIDQLVENLIQIEYKK